MFLKILVLLLATPYASMILHHARILPYYFIANDRSDFSRFIRLLEAVDMDALSEYDAKHGTQSSNHLVEILRLADLNHFNLNLVDFSPDDINSDGKFLAMFLIRQLSNGVFNQLPYLHTLGNDIVNIIRFLKDDCKMKLEKNHVNYIENDDESDHKNNAIVNTKHYYTKPYRPKMSGLEKKKCKGDETEKDYDVSVNTKENNKFFYNSQYLDESYNNFGGRPRYSYLNKGFHDNFVKYRPKPLMYNNFQSEALNQQRHGTGRVPALYNRGQYDYHWRHCSDHQIYHHHHHYYHLPCREDDRLKKEYFKTEENEKQLPDNNFEDESINNINDGVDVKMDTSVAKSHKKLMKRRYNDNEDSGHTDAEDRDNTEVGDITEENKQDEISTETLDGEATTEGTTEGYKQDEISTETLHSETTELQ